MDSIRFAENIVTLRKEKKITQEQLADFCGVTKASVSKWETKQTMPDVLLLPRLAGFFGITIDELIGYEVCLSEEQIQKVYEDLALGFVTKTFEEVWEQCRGYVKQYYSCYELLAKIVLLLINHEMLAGEHREEVLFEAKALCVHILENCRNIGLCNDVVFLKSFIDLFLGNAADVIEALEDMNNPCRLSVQGEEVLLSAYIQAGMLNKANDYAQVTMYIHLMSLLSNACKFLVVHKDNLEICEETRKRIEALADIYNMEQINFHFVAMFAYQMAEIYCQHGKYEMSLEQLERYVTITEKYIIGKITYIGWDKFLDRLHVWFERTLLAGSYPIEKKVVCERLCIAMEAPAFAELRGQERFETLRKRVKEVLWDGGKK